MEISGPFECESERRHNSASGEGLWSEDATGAAIRMAAVGSERQLLEIVHALSFTGRFSRLGDGRKDQAGKCADDWHHHQQFHKGEPRWAADRGGRLPHRKNILAVGYRPRHVVVNVQEPLAGLLGHGDVSFKRWGAIPSP